MILQKMISRFWWYSQVLCLNHECAHKLRHSLLGNIDIDIGINLVELYNTERPKMGPTVCVQWILPHGLYDYIPVQREGRRSVLPFQWYKHRWTVQRAAICQTKDCLFETIFSIQELAQLSGLHIVVYSNSAQVPFPGISCLTALGVKYHVDGNHGVEQLKSWEMRFQCWNWKPWSSVE